MSFRIQDHCDFDSQGRAVCPNCNLEGKGRKKNLALVPGTNGAYKCHRGCTPDQIRAALGQSKPRIVATSPKVANTISPQKVKAHYRTLREKSTHALEWLRKRGIHDQIVERYQLGITTVRVGDRRRPAITIPIPNEHGTGYWLKKRVEPWVDESEQPQQYQPWSQWGIPQQVFFTHKPEKAEQTYLCEGEWDAMMLGWLLRNSQHIAVGCFTCGCSAYPQVSELDRLPGKVTIFYDHDDPGRKGANKLAQALGKRSEIALVPGPESGEVPKGWDISDYLNSVEPESALAAINKAAAAAKQFEPPPSDNPLRQRLVSNDELMARAADYTDWLVDQILTSDELFLLAAPPRKGKSLLAFTLARAVATGEKFLGRPVSQGAVLYIRCEDSETKTKEREIKQGWTEGMSVYWLDKFKLGEINYLWELVEELEIRLVVFDTLSRVRDSGISESSAEMSQLLEPIQEMCKALRVCGLLVHHTGKVNLQNAGEIDVFDTIRGSSAIRATCRGTLILASDDRCYRLAVENGWGKLDLEILLDANTLHWKLLGNWQGPDVDMNQADRVLAYLTKVGSATIEQVAEATNMPKASLYVVLRRLQSDEMVKKRGERRSAIYTRSAIEQIEHVQNMFNSSNPDREKFSSLSNKSTKGGDPPEKLDHLQKLDQKNDPVLEPAQPNKLLENSPNAYLKRDSELNMNLTTIEHGDPDHTKLDRASCPKPSIRTGCKVRYIGSKPTMERICGRKQLTVVSVESDKMSLESDRAEIKHDAWLVTQTVPVSDLKIVKEPKS